MILIKRDIMHLLKITQRKLQAFLKYQKKNGTNWLDEPLEYLFKYHRCEMPDQMSWGKWSDIIVRQLVKVFMRRTLQDGSASTCSLNKKDVLVTSNDGCTKNITYHDHKQNFGRGRLTENFALSQSKLKAKNPPHPSLEKMSTLFVVRVRFSNSLWTS